jgi:hypothetical protein
MRHDWDKEGVRAATSAQQPDRFVRQHAAPLLYHPTLPAKGNTKEFSAEEDFWEKSKSITFASVCLDRFRLTDWFPRAPGVYWSRRGISARQAAWSHNTTNDPELGQIFAPRSKMALIEDGGIGTIRLRPRRIDGTDCWLATAVNGVQCAGGIPLALPNTFLQQGDVSWGDTVVIRGTVRFLQDAGLDDTAAYVHHASPLIIFVEEIDAVSRRQKSMRPVIVSPVALFDALSGERRTRDWGGEYGYTFVQCAEGFGDGLEGAADWISRYATKHDGRIITNFDEQSPVLADAPLSYQRLIKRTYDRTIIEHLHLQQFAQRIDLAVTTEYNNYGQAGAFGENAKSKDVKFSGPVRAPVRTGKKKNATEKGKAKAKAKVSASEKRVEGLSSDNSNASYAYNWLGERDPVESGCVFRHLKTRERHGRPARWRLPTPLP